MAEIVPFPLVRRRGYVMRQAEWIASMSAKGGQNALAHQVRTQRESLLRKGVDPARVDRECRELEIAIRAAAGFYSRAGGAA